jgi:hypothetical protein
MASIIWYMSRISEVMNKLHENYLNLSHKTHITGVPLSKISQSNIKMHSDEYFRGSSSSSHIFSNVNYSSACNTFIHSDSSITFTSLIG